MANIKHPFYPIIYVRGYAMTESEINATVATPYMGFNLGATSIQQTWDGKIQRHIFESPLIRLMKDLRLRRHLPARQRGQGKNPAGKRHHLSLLRRNQR